MVDKFRLSWLTTVGFFAWLDLNCTQHKLSGNKNIITYTFSWQCCELWTYCGMKYPFKKELSFGIQREWKVENMEPSTL